MYAWYEKFEVCYAYLSDVEVVPDECEANPKQTDYGKSKWFTRGWTLQELLAPTKVQFFGAHWRYLGHKETLPYLISDITRIPERFITRKPGAAPPSIAQRMSWAAGRKTTRTEDLAYSLLGIFDVNMPLLYGEGSKAFIRLQEEILKISNDHSLFAFCRDGGYEGPLAESIDEFKDCENIVPFPNKDGTPYSMTNRGLNIQLPIIGIEFSDDVWAILDCHFENDFSGPLGVRLNGTKGSAFHRYRPGTPRVVMADEVVSAKIRTIFISRTPKEEPQSQYGHITCTIQCGSMLRHGYRITNAGFIGQSRYDIADWYPETNSVRIPLSRQSTSVHAAFEFQHPHKACSLMVWLCLAPDNSRAKVVSKAKALARQSQPSGRDYFGSDGLYPWVKSRVMLLEHSLVVYCCCSHHVDESGEFSDVKVKVRKVKMLNREVHIVDVWVDIPVPSMLPPDRWAVELARRQSPSYMPTPYVPPPYVPPPAWMSLPTSM